MNELAFYQAGLIGGVGDLVGERALSAVGALLLLAIGMLTRKYIIPLLKTAQAKQTAGHVLLIADDITDYFAEKYPSAHWSVWLDRAVDKITDVTGVNRGPAERAVRASVNRKKGRLAAGEGKIEGRS
ncbi:MAG: hypothetical protein GY839_11680 [candidate division Zixibacteria bacterium]|nr:hypothetical protein [candidate division Zixibacteria bacterium]